MQRLLDGASSPAEEQALRQHVAACAECRALWQAMTEVERALASPPMAPVPPGFAHRTMARLRTAPRVPTAQRGWVIPALAAALAVLVLAIWWGALLLGGGSLYLSGESQAALRGAVLLGDVLTAFLGLGFRLADLAGAACRLVVMGAAGMVLLALLMGLAAGLRRASARA